MTAIPKATGPWDMVAALFDDLSPWTRLLHLGVGALPGVIQHLNVENSGLAYEHRLGIKVHYGLMR